MYPIKRHIFRVSWLIKPPNTLIVLTVKIEAHGVYWAVYYKDFICWSLHAAQAACERCTAVIVYFTGRRAADVLSRFARLVGFDVNAERLQFGSPYQLNLNFTSMNTQYFIAV